MSDQPVRFSTRKTSLLFAYMAMQAGQAVPRDRLKGLLWSDRGEAQASGSLRRALVDIRKALDTGTGIRALDSTQTTVTLMAEAVEVDAQVFQDLAVRRSPQHDLSAADLYVGDLLEEISAPDRAFDDWLRIERERLRLIAIELVERLAENARTPIALAAAAGLAGRLLRADPACEEAHRALIVSYRRSGRTNAAIKQYAACIEALRAGLGVEPEDKTRSLLDSPLLETMEQAADEAPRRPSQEPKTESRSESERPLGPMRAPGNVVPGAAQGPPRPVLLAADVAGYDRLATAPVEGTATRFADQLSVITDLVREHRGNIVSAGDGRLIAAFYSPTHAVLSAIAIQIAANRRNADFIPEHRLEFRTCVDFGEPDVAEHDSPGHGTAFVQLMKEVAGPGEICISAAVHQCVRDSPFCNNCVDDAHGIHDTEGKLVAYRLNWRNSDAAPRHVPNQPLALPDRPSIAVLPFVNLSENPEHEYLAEALAEDVITALSRYRWFFVIARTSSFFYRDRLVDIKQIARELGVRYVLEGSVRTVGGRVRVTAQLVEAENGAHIWAQRYDRDLHDIFAVQDELTQSVVGAIEPEILMGEGWRAVSRPTQNLDAYAYCMRGVWHHHQPTAEHLEKAIEYHRKAIELDPGFARAHMGLARALYVRCLRGYSDDIDRDRAEVTATAERAVTLDGRDAYCHFAMFLAHIISSRHAAALGAAQRAIDLNPNFALGHLALGRVRALTGQFSDALGPLYTALRLSPRDPTECYTYVFIADVHYQRRDYQEAADMSERALSARPSFDFAMLIRAASLGQLGRIDEARKKVPRMKLSDPAQAAHYWEVVFPYANPSYRSHLIDGLRKAGMHV